MGSLGILRLWDFSQNPVESAKCSGVSLYLHTGRVEALNNTTRNHQHCNHGQSKRREVTRPTHSRPRGSRAAASQLTLVRKVPHDGSGNGNYSPRDSDSDSRQRRTRAASEQ